MVGEGGLSTELETSSMSAERNEDWIHQSLAITVTEDFWQKWPLSVLGAKEPQRGLHCTGQCGITGRVGPEKQCYRTKSEACSLLGITAWEN